jgi:hypothetical protein
MSVRNSGLGAVIENFGVLVPFKKMAENPAQAETYGEVSRIPEGLPQANSKPTVAETTDEAHKRLEGVERALRFAGYVPS